MTALTATTNHQVRLARRPSGMPVRADWSFTAEPVAEPVEGGVLVRTLSLSLDPAMRGWMNEGKSYIAPVGIDEVMRAATGRARPSTRRAAPMVSATSSRTPCRWR